MATQSLSPEMTSYARLCLAINDVCTKSFRDVLLRNVPYQDIKQAIVARWGHQYNRPQFDKYPYSVLFPNHQLDPNFSVSDCDLSLLYFLIRNASSVQKPLSGWGKSVMNNPRDTSIGANVERLHELRNTVIHLKEPILSNQEFNSYWNKLRDCVTDIDTYLGGTMYQQKLECLKTDDMDPDYANRLIESFRSSLQDLQARQHEQGQTLSDIREVLNQGFHDIKTADDCTIEGLSEVKDLIKDENRQLPQIAKDVNETKDIVKEIRELMEGKAKENDKTQPQLNSDHGVRTEDTTSNQDEHESEITLEKHDSQDSENTTDCNENRVEKTDVDKSSRRESLAVQVQLKTNDVLVKADHENNGGIEIGDLASGLDGKLCITKKYAFIKSNLEKESGLVIAQYLLKQKLLSQDAYDLIGNTCCRRRHTIDILLKRVIHGGKEEIVEAFLKRLNVECPLIARAVKDTTITDVDRSRFAQLEARGVETGGLFRTMWCVTSTPDVRFFKYHLSAFEEDVEHITDVMLSRLHFSIQDHSKIIDRPTLDDRISVLFQTMQLYKLDIVKEVSDVKPELHQKWMEFRSTQDPWWSRLFQWLKQSKPVIDGSFEFEDIELKEVETGSIILKFITGVNFSVDLLKPESLKNKIKTLLKRGCLESKTETKSAAHITVYIESPPNKGREEIHIYIDFHATDVSIEAEDHQAEMRIRNRDIMLEEMNPAPLKQWMLAQPWIQKSHRDMLESKLSEKDQFRQEEMTVLLDFINGLENGDHLLEKYCEKNDLYVYNKVYRKHQESHSQQEEITGHRVAVTYVKGGGLQELFSFSIIFNDEGIDPDTEEDKDRRLEDPLQQMKELLQERPEMMTESHKTEKTGERWREGSSETVTEADNDETNFIPPVVQDSTVSTTGHTLSENTVMVGNKNCNNNYYVHCIDPDTEEDKDQRLEDPVQQIKAGIVSYDEEFIINNSESYMDRSSSFSRNTSCSSFDDDKWQKEFKMHEDFMPSELRKKFYDVMVLYSGNNRADARKFCDHLKKDIKLNNAICVNAALYDEFVHQVGPRWKLLEIAIERSTYIFFFMTKEFCEDTWIELSREECLMEAIYNEEKKWCVVPVYTENPEYSNFNIPVGVRALKGINYYRNDLFYKIDVGGLIQNRLHQRLEKERKQKELQNSWLQKYKRENMEKMETQLEMEQKIKGKDVNEGLQDIGLFSLNPDVDGKESESDDQSQNNQMTPVNQSPSCWGTEVTVEEEEDQNLETNSKDESMSVKKTMEKKERLYEIFHP